MMIEGIPLPDREGPYEAGFWAALDRGEIAHQHCAACGAWHFPARWRCPCGHALDYRPVSGMARLWSWTQVHPPVLPAFAPLCPYVVGIAQLVEADNLRMVGPLLLQPGDPMNRILPENLHIGVPLRATITRIGDDTFWPSWVVL